MKGQSTFICSRCRRTVNRSKLRNATATKRCKTTNFNPKLFFSLFKDPKPSDYQIKAKFYEADESEVIKQIHCFKTGDNQANLVNLMSQMVGLGNSYELWENGDSRKLGQLLNRALSGQVKDNWQELLEEVDDWNNVNKDEFI